MNRPSLFIVLHSRGLSVVQCSDCMREVWVVAGATQTQTEDDIGVSKADEKDNRNMEESKTKVSCKGNAQYPILLSECNRSK